MPEEVRKIRPGHVIRDVLSRNMACCTDICNEYQRLTEEENISRELEDKPPLRSMTVGSFVNLMRFARHLGLIAFDHQEPAKYHGGPLYRVEKPDGAPTALVSQRRYYKLTDKGHEELIMWDDLTWHYKLSLGHTKR